MSAIDRENAKLEAAHGSIGSKPTYQWMFSENLYFPFRKRNSVTGEPEREYRANPETGIIEVHPVFELRKMCQSLHRQWVLCRFMPPPRSESQWVAEFGTKVDYLANGYYADTNVVLDPGMNPWDCGTDGATFTDMIIKMAANDRAKTKAQWDAEGQAILDRQEREKDRKMDELIGEVILPFPNSPHVPGKRGGPVSFGGV